MRVAVIGGGLSGLSAAIQLAGRADVTLLEASHRLGGQIRTTSERGFTVEEGAEGYLAASRTVAAFIERLGLAHEVLPQADLPSYALLNGALDRLEAGKAAALLGIRTSPGSTARGLATLRPGMEAMVTRARELFDPSVRISTGCPVTGLARDGTTWRVEAGESIRADAVILAVPAPVAARLVAPLLPDAGALLRGLRARSSLTISLAYRRAAIQDPLDATGFVVSAGDESGLRACTYSSTKFPGRAPSGHALLRVFFRPVADELNELSTADWITRAGGVITSVLGATEAPAAAWVSRWPAGLPDYSTAYDGTVTRVEAALEPLGTLVLAGSAYHGPGIEGAIRSGMKTALQVVARYQTRGQGVS